MRLKKSWIIPAALAIGAVSALVSLPGHGQSVDAKAGPASRDTAVSKAAAFAGLQTVSSAVQSRVVSSHTNYIQVIGTDDRGRVATALNPANGEIVRLIKLCPYPGVFEERLTIDRAKAEAICREFLAARKLPSIPKDYVIQVARERKILNGVQYEIVFRHQRDGVAVLPDGIAFVLGGSGDVIFFSKIHHDIEVSTKPKLPKAEAVRIAAKLLGQGNLKAYPPDLKPQDPALKIVYPNLYFEKGRWEWTERQALVWVIPFGDKDKPVIDVWIDAQTGQIQGGEAYERPIPDLIGIPDQTGDITGIWQPALNLMQYNTGTARTVLGDTTEATVVSAIANGTTFILQTHGGTTATAESATIGHGGTFDQNTLEPDEVPANTLYYALLSCCESGHDGPGTDFQDTFISRGALCFQGYSPSINPDPYETALVRYLAVGESLYNAHALAVADTTPWFDIIIRWQAWCLNAIYLAPLKVFVGAPANAGCQTTVTATVYNSEAARATTATHVRAYLKLPAGFSLTAGPILQSTAALPYGHSWTASWKVKAPFWTFADKTFDVIVWSDNLGVAVQDFDDPYHKFKVHFGCPLWIPIYELALAEIFRWWEWAEELYPESPVPAEILAYQDKFLKSYRSEYFFKQDAKGFLRALMEIAEQEALFGKAGRAALCRDRKAVDDYLGTVDRMKAWLGAAGEKGVGDVLGFYKELGILQAAVNEKAIAAFAPTLPEK